MNKELGQKVYDHFVAHPEEHDQGSFVNYCGTTMCIAGRTLVESGEYWVEIDSPWAMPIFRRVDNNETADPPRAAQALLGISRDEAMRLFFDMQEPDAALDYLSSLINE